MRSDASSMNADNAVDHLGKLGGSNLVRLDGRTRVARRVAALRRVFGDAVGIVTPVVAVRINDAAHLQAIAERSRERFLADDAGVSADDLVRLERKAEAAVKALGIGRAVKPQGPTLAEYLRAKGALR